MKAAFGPALPVGSAGESEYYDIWLTRYTRVEELLELLREATPQDLAPTAAGFVAESEPSLTAALTIALYELDVTGKESSAEKVRAAVSRLVESGTLSVTQKGKAKVFDLARSLPKETRVTESAEGSRVVVTVRMGPTGSLRPEALVRAALESASLDASVARVTRTDTLIETEEGGWARPL
jgi:radical SAM-linked protein